VQFWRNLGGRDKPRERSFLGALAITLKEIAVHASFFKCEANRARSWGHILMLGGFVAAMITTGAIFVFVFIPHYLELLGLQQIESFFALPVDLPNPVKFIGMFGGLGLMIGGGLLIIRRWNNKDQVGANGYADYLFLYIIFLAGFTGMLSWLTRLTGVAMVAYISYFIHLVIVFFLLWYMPYSKFAHMIYRTLALVHSRMIGREARAA
jgi:quinone-modifying oxidoreductase subunit QmoC